MAGGKPPCVPPALIVTTPVAIPGFPVGTEDISAILVPATIWVTPAPAPDVDSVTVKLATVKLQISSSTAILPALDFISRNVPDGPTVLGSQ